MTQQLESLERRVLMSAAAAGLSGLVRAPAGPNIQGTVYYDRNSNSRRDAGEEGIGGAIVFLDNDWDGKLDASERVVFTDASGRYLFDGLEAAGYRVGAEGLGHWSGDTFVDLTNWPRGGPSPDFGIGSATLVGRAFNDLNGSGMQEWRGEQLGNEPALAGWQVFLDENHNAVLDAGERSTTTSVNGDYRFENVAPKLYTLRIVGQRNWRSTLNGSGVSVKAVWGHLFGNMNFGKAYVAPDAPLAPQSIANTVSGFMHFREDGTIGNGANYFFIDVPLSYRWRVNSANVGELTITWGTSYGGRQTVSYHSGAHPFRDEPLCELVVDGFYDANGNGALDAGEPFIGGAPPVYLDLNENGIRDGGEPSGFGDGLRHRTSFSELVPGTYTVRYGGTTPELLTTPAVVTVTVAPSGAFADHLQFGFSNRNAS